MNREVLPAPFGPMTASTLPFAIVMETSSRLVTPPKRVARATGPVIEKIGFSERALNLEPGAKFAEIHVMRSETRGEKTSFVWWTEPGSAAADADFVPQQHTTAYFSPRNHMATLFVKLVPNAKRKKSQVFYLNIAEASTGAAIGTTSRAAITLLPRGA